MEENLMKPTEFNQDEQANSDWGAVEQAAFERLHQEKTINVTQKEFLDWLSELERDSNQEQTENP